MSSGAPQATPWRRPSESCPYFCCSDFNKAVDLQVPPGENYCDLQNPISPLFEYDKFRQVCNEKAYWLYYADSARLASRLIETDHACRYILTMAEGDLYHEDVKIKLRRGRKATFSGGYEETFDASKDFPFKRHRNLLAFPKSSHNKITEELRSKSRQIMADLSQMLRYGAHRLKVGNAFSTTYVRGPLLRARHNQYPQGSMAFISIDANVMSSLKDCMDTCNRLTLTNGWTREDWNDHDTNFRSRPVRPHRETIPSWIFRLSTHDLRGDPLKTSQGEEPIMWPCELDDMEEVSQAVAKNLGGIIRRQQRRTVKSPGEILESSAPFDQWRVDKNSRKRKNVGSPTSVKPKRRAGWPYFDDEKVVEVEGARIFFDDGRVTRITRAL